MPRAPFFCLAIVAAFPLHLAAASPVDDAPIAPRVAELAERLGIEPARDRARFMTDIARLLYATSDSKQPDLIVARAAVGTYGGTAHARVSVPVPLPAAVWSLAVFRRTVTTEQLIATILSDRRATLLCRGLSGVDDETLRYLAEHPPIVRFLYEHASGVFAAFGASLRIHDGRIVSPGGPPAEPLWEAVVGESLGMPEQFVRALFAEYDGRLAYLYDAIGSASPPALAFALGFWIPDVNQRTERFRALANASVTGYREWRPGDHPFSRPLGDLAILLLRIRVESSGVPSAPSGRSFWAVAFDVDENLSSSGDAPLVGGPDGPIDAAWMISATAGSDMYSRTERLDQFAFGQRVFNGVTGATSARAAEALRGFRQYRMLMLTIERMGIRAPSSYVAALQRAAEVASGDMGRRFWALSQFQGSIALLARMRRAGTLSLTSATALLTSLCAVPLQDDHYDGGVAHWLRSEFAKALPPDGTWEARTIAAIAGTSDEAAAPRLLWEGQAYRLDLPFAERQRLEIVRNKQGGHTLDLALAIDGLARTVRSPGLTVDAAQSASRRVKMIAAESAARLKHPPVILLPPSVELPRDGLEWMTNAAEELSKITRSNDLRRAARVGASLHQLVDIVLGDALLSMAYAADIGDPEGAALLAGNVSLRHDFGFARKDSATRQRLPWLLPRQDFQPGVPWHITGSLLGLDIALAPLNLRRLTMDRIAEAPKLSSIEREAFAVDVALIDPLRLKDADRDAIAAAIGRGRERVNALAAGAESLGAVAELLGFDGWRQRAVAWTIQHEPAAVARQFSLVDLLTLGGGAAGADLDAWGTSAIHTDGCACTQLPKPRSWRVLEGRPQIPMMAATMGDFSLAMALMLREMNLPAALARPVLAIAMQDFIDEMDPAYSTDWWSLSRDAQALRRQRVEDYVSAAAAVNGPLVPVESDSSRNH